MVADPIIETLREVRAERGLTRSQVAALCGVSEAALRSYELGNRLPPLPAIRRWAAAFGYQVTLAGAGEVAGG